MKRGGPLKRTGSLKRTSGLKRTEGLKRTGGTLKRSQRAPSVATREGIGAEAWRKAAFRRQGWLCAVTGEELSWYRDDCHHPISRQELRRRGLDEFDIRNAVAVKARVHERHTNAVERIPRGCLPPCVMQYAKSLGQWAVVLLEREHPA